MSNAFTSSSGLLASASIMMSGLTLVEFGADLFPEIRRHHGGHVAAETVHVARP